MMEATSDECLGKESKQYAETAVVPAIIENAMKAQEMRMAIQCSVCSNAWPYSIRPTKPTSVEGLMESAFTLCAKKADISQLTTLPKGGSRARICRHVS